MSEQMRLSSPDAEENDSEAHESARERLAELLRDPEFRATLGFPQGSDDAILAMSYPSHYTACPNPFLTEFVEQHGRPYDPDEPYHREPFAVDVSVGKTDALYRAHGYHTKVPHLAIVPSILHYTNPGDIVLDGFCGSGMTGVAAQWCGNAPASYRRELEATWNAEGRDAPEWGTRKAILNDLSPAATFIAYNYNIPFPTNDFAQAAQKVLNETKAFLSWMYETTHTDGSIGEIEYTVWSEVFICASCSSEIIFTDAAMNFTTYKVADVLLCPNCGASASKESLELVFEPHFEHLGDRVEFRPRRVPVLISYRVNGVRHEKRPDDGDLALLQRIEILPSPVGLPDIQLPDSQMTRVGRMRTTKTSSIGAMFLPRAAYSLSDLWNRASKESNPRVRQSVLYFVEQAIWGMSVLNRYQPIQQGSPGGSQVNRQLSGVFYVASQTAEVSPWYNLSLRLDRLIKAFHHFRSLPFSSMVSTGDCSSLPIPSHSVDYIFTDPPFGENIYYADLNFLVESWHKVVTDASPEAIIDRVRAKALPDYHRLMQGCFEEYFRVLKPGRWMTVVFHNSRNSVWNAIQEAIVFAGFVVADVRTLDKQQGSFQQVTSTAVKQDLVISAYKPTQRFEEQFKLEAGTPAGAWDFVREHLARLPVVVKKGDLIEAIAERQRFRLFDRMVAFHIQHGVTVPLSSAAFYAGLEKQFIQRDGMYFLPDQVSEYDTVKFVSDGLGQLSYFVRDEKSTVQWLRSQLDPAFGGSPQTYQQIQPKFLQQLNQARHERLPELSEILAQNFLEDDADRWYAPDPTKAGDLEKLRTNALLREFATYLQGRGKLKQFRSEAIRAGFADAFAKQEFRTIVEIAERLPEEVLQEDPDLLMFYDAASLRG